MNRSHLAFLVLLAASPLLAQPAPTGPPSGPQLWRNIGPDRGGRSLTVAGSSARPNEYFFGAVGGVVNTSFAMTPRVSEGRPLSQGTASGNRNGVVGNKTEWRRERDSNPRYR